MKSKLIQNTHILDLTTDSGDFKNYFKHYDRSAEPKRSTVENEDCCSNGSKTSETTTNEGEQGQDKQDIIQKRRCQPPEPDPGAYLARTSSSAGISCPQVTGQESLK